jgi:hypothetical protein
VVDQPESHDIMPGSPGSCSRPRACLPGRPRVPRYVADHEVVTDVDLDEFNRTYSREGGFHGAAGLCRSLLADGPDIRR